MVCCIISARTGIGSIPDFLWSGVKLPVWLPAFLSTITYAVDVRMAHARPFSTSTLQGFSNGTKNISRQGVLISAIELWSCGSLGGLQVLTFGSVNLILTLAPKWGCDIVYLCCPWLILAPKVFQLCTNHLVLVFCRLVWVSETCQLFLVPSRSSSTPLYLSKVMRARERALTPYSSVVFCLGFTFESLKELGVRHMWY
jgi:hypothetical protein